MLKLVEANEKYLKEYKEAYLEYVNLIEKDIIHRHNQMFLNPDETDVIKYFNDSKDINKVPKGLAPSYDYFFVDDDKLIGIIRIRIYLTDYLLQYGGNIGYGINPRYFKQGYGTKLLKLGLEKAKELIKEDKVLVTCDDDNIGSYKIIEKNGGILENKVMITDAGETFLTRRYWIKMRW